MTYLQGGEGASMKVKVRSRPARMEETVHSCQNGEEEGLARKREGKTGKEGTHK